MSTNKENPVEGKGSEMLPERGLPVDRPEGDEPGENESVDLNPENIEGTEAAGIEGEVIPSGEEASPELTGLPPRDNGMGAGFPVPDSELENLEEGSTQDVPLPPPEAMEGAPLFSEASFLAPGPKTVSGEVGSPQISGDLQASDEMVEMLVTDQRVEDLWVTADEVQDKITYVIDDLNVARQLLDQLRSARTWLLAGKENFEEAERAINEALFRVAYTERVETWSNTDAVRLAIYEVVWGVLIAVGVWFIPPLFRRIVQDSAATAGLALPSFITPDDVFNALSAMMWGGIGGVVGALYALWRHVSEKQDFSPQYNMWYYTQPIMGIPIGAFIFLFVEIGFTVTAGSVNVQVGSPFVMYLLAWIAGFQQNVVYDIVRQVLRLFKIGG